MTKVEKLVDRIKSELDIETNPKTFHRVYTGYWQRSRGAMSWSMQVVGHSNKYVCSQSSVTELLKAKKLSEYFNPDVQSDIQIDAVKT
jgi:hypothetical protein